MAIPNDQSLEQYLQEIGGYKLLHADEEVELAKRIRKGDQVALDKLVKHNLRFVVSVAKQYQGQDLTIKDLISEGNLGLVKAAQRFDHTRGFKFISYAVWWIRQSILQALAEQSRVVRFPLNRIGKMNKIGKMLSVLENSFEREPTAQELADQLDMLPEEVSEYLGQSRRHLSIDEPFRESEEGHRLLDVLENDEAPAPDRTLVYESLKIEIQRALATLTRREAEVIKLYFGLGIEHPLTLEEIGEHFKLTRERVRQIKEKAVKRLRYSSRSKPLRDFLGL